MAMALAAIQIGLFLLLRDRLNKAWRPVQAMNKLAMPIYLWHQSALLLTLLAGSAIATTIPGLLGEPTSTGWVLHRLAWLPIFATVLASLLFVLTKRARSAAAQTKEPSTRSWRQRQPQHTG
jgi:hypothetical protein